jgi:CHAD domain-containing protein
MSAAGGAIASETTSQRRLAGGMLRRQARRMGDEIDGVITAVDVESVHRMRVASRRMRSILRMFGTWLPKSARNNWLPAIGKVTKALGAARDLDVQLEALAIWRAGLPGGDRFREQAIDWLIGHYLALRVAAQPKAIKRMERLRDSKLLRKIHRWGREHGGKVAPEVVPRLLEVHSSTLREQVADVLAGAQAARDIQRIQEHHATRLAVKRVRYTLEALSPLGPEHFEPLIAGVRRLQVALGNLHDCDVWIERLPQDRYEAAAQGADSDVLAGIDGLLADRRQERIALFNAFLRAWDAELTAGIWERIGRIEALIADQDQSKRVREMNLLAAVDWDLGLQRLRDACDPDQDHTNRVALHADQLFIALNDLHGLDSEARGWLREAAWLHDIGWSDSGQPHHKASLRLILIADELDWNDRHRQLVGSLARYHRKALPSEGHAHFAALSKADRAQVQKLAALLRIADGLDYAHEEWLKGVGGSWTSTSLDINCQALKPPTCEVERALAKADLARLVFDRDVTVTWHLQDT